MVLSARDGFAFISADVGTVPSGSRFEVDAGLLGLCCIHLSQLVRISHGNSVQTHLIKFTA